MHEQEPGLERDTRAFSFPTTRSPQNAFTHRWGHSMMAIRGGRAEPRREGQMPPSLPPHIQGPQFQSLQNYLGSSRQGFLNLGTTAV